MTCDFNSTLFDTAFLKSYPLCPRHRVHLTDLLSRYGSWNHLGWRSSFKRKYFSLPYVVVMFNGYFSRQLQQIKRSETSIQQFLQEYGPSARDCYAYCELLQTPHTWQGEKH